MATTIKGEKGKTTVGAKTRSTSKIKSRGRGQTKIGKPARKPKNRKVKARVGAGALKRKSNKGGVGPTPSLPPSVASGGLEFWAPTIESAVATMDRTITLNLFYAEAGWNRFLFKRKNLTTQITTEFAFDVDLQSTDDLHFTVDDIGQALRDHRDPIGLDPETSYEYRVTAFYRYYGYSPWSDAVIGTTLNTPFQPTFQDTLGYDEEGWEGYCLVQRIEEQAQLSDLKKRYYRRVEAECDAI
jgi:hypothetical protein